MTNCGGYVTSMTEVSLSVLCLFIQLTLIDTLPHEILIKLRANRPDATLPDSHGQIWTELATIAATNPELFQGNSASIEREMREILGLSGPVRFPTSRLVTLWGNINWRSMITRWCHSEIGQSTFNISTWDAMAQRRIDDVSQG